MSVDQASGLTPLARATLRPDAACSEPAARCIATVSGKGGVGKTNLVANLAVAAARMRRRVLVVDGDLGLANVDVLLGLAPRESVAGVLEGRCTVQDALVVGPRGIHILPAASARSELAALSGETLARLVRLLWDAARRYDLVLVDAGAGVGPAVVGLAAACARTLVVTTAEPTSLADAYATVKVLRHRAAHLRPELVVNDVRRARDALATHARLERMTRRFLDTDLPYRGHLPRDPRLHQAVARQRAVVEMFPAAVWSKHVFRLAEDLLQEMGASGPTEPLSGAEATQARRTDAPG